MSSKILIKRSTTTGAVPTTSDLDTGELAINTVDKKLYTNNSGTIVEIGVLPSAIDVTNNATVGGTLAVTGNTTLSTGSTSGDFSVAGSLTLSTQGTLASHVVTKGYVDSVDTLKLNKAGDTMSGNLAMGSNKVTGLDTPTDNDDAATKGYVDASIADILDGAPAALDTLNELAAAINDDDDFAATITTALAGKLSLTGGTMTGDIAMGSNEITSSVDPSSNDTLSRKAYVDDQVDTKVSKAGDTLTGNLVMGVNSVTSTANPTTDDELARKGYVDTILGSATDAATSASEAATSASNAANSASSASTSETNTAASEGNAASSATAAAASASAAASSASSASSSASAAATSAASASTSASSAESAWDSLDDRYLGAKASDPTTDNDGNTLLTGAMYFDSTNNVTKVYNGTDWQAASSSIEGIKSDFQYTATASQTVFSGNDDNTNELVIDKAGLTNVFLNGVRLVDSDYTVDVGANSVTLASGASVNDVVEIEVFGNFAGQSGADVAITGGSITGLTELSTGTFTSTGIDDNATSTAITIDASENVGIGTASPSNTLDLRKDSPAFSQTSSSGAYYTTLGTNVDYTKSFVLNNKGSEIITYGDDSGFGLNLNGGAANLVRFQTNSTERMRIDSSGNLLVGKTSADYNTVGAEILPSGRVFGIASGLSPFYANRKGSDGSIVDFAKDGAAVGSIGTSGGHLTLSSSGSLLLTDGTITPFDYNDGTEDLGRSNARFKDLYLSGGVRKQESMVFSSNVTRHDFAFIGNTNPDSSVYGDRTHAHEIFLEGNNLGYDLVFNMKKRDIAGGVGPDVEAMRIDESGGLILNRGVYLGGTGAANKLDDYEEGTFSGSTADHQNMVGGTYSGRYTKIGRLVYISFVTSALSITASSSRASFSISVPLAIAQGGGSPNQGVGGTYWTGGGTDGFIVDYTGGDANRFSVTLPPDRATSGSTLVYGSITYETTA